jgi:hypothetical protein
MMRMMRMMRLFKNEGASGRRSCLDHSGSLVLHGPDLWFLSSSTLSTKAVVGWCWMFCVADIRNEMGMFGVSIVQVKTCERLGGMSGHHRRER